VDIGFGDAVVPSPLPLTYPTLLDFPAPELQVYPRETAVSEKLQAMVALGQVTSRMKDFYDIWLLARLFAFDGNILSDAIRATFERRGTTIPTTVPSTLTDEFASDHLKQTQWNAFVSRGRFIERPPGFKDVVAFLREFIVPPLNGASSKKDFVEKWLPGGPWRYCQILWMAA
jgi:hypothetical protein